MSASINFHGPYAFIPRAYEPGRVKHHPAAYASFEITDPKGNDVTLYFTGPGEIGALIEAAAKTRDLLTAAQGDAS